MKTQPIEANADSRCHCCGRVHRKLYLVESYWLGVNCAEDVKMYLTNSDITALYWRGYEAKHAKVAITTVPSQRGDA